MHVFRKYISPKFILNIMLGIAIIGTVFILFAVSRMNNLLNTDLEFNKDSVISIRTQESKIILPDSLVFSSELPGFHVKKSIEVKTEYKKENVKIAHQFVSESYFDFFNYKKINEKRKLFLNHGDAQLVYINESAVEELGINCIDDAPGTRILTVNNLELIVCGVVKDFSNLCVSPGNQAKIYQINGEHLAYAFYDQKTLNEEHNENLLAQESLTFQQRIQNRYRIIEDSIYSLFFFVNVIILIIGIGFIGYKYNPKNEVELYKVLGIGINVITLIISKTYLYLIAIIGFVAGPLAYIIQKFWLDIYIYRIHFGLADLFIILSMSLLTVYLVCCPKSKLNDQLKGKAINVNSI